MIYGFGVIDSTTAFNPVSKSLNLLTRANNHYRSITKLYFKIVVLYAI